MDLNSIETALAGGLKKALRALVDRVAAHPRFATVAALGAIAAAFVLAKVL
ncbi:hypothetical protein [Methylobacterium organophilum]|uniref:Uncharacterized protein n=1 Tax=Methylobacterium organophilum TaxID=410 RepID=A0ABQ4T3N0_METOR|nr:hypothetical protein [Methylobacterium organophilum]GJE26235.1 hypothetical protein LKMONMHP_1084 [Methylobacterium organophilum]